LDYYFDIDIKLETKFIIDLESTYDRILKFPNLYPYETKTSQKILMEIFPYIVLYEQFEDIIMILAIFHTSRDDKELSVRR
jgi:plasmid stabilization system protein ParE